MQEHFLYQLVTIVGLGIFAQWLGWGFRIPAILILILLGIVIGPVFGLIHPDKLFGDLLSPIVSLSVGIILFEGGLNLHLKELKGIGLGFQSLVTLGVLITWSTSALLAHYLMGLNIEIAVILGALLTVTGPTVIMPLLRHLRLSGKAGSILKWEGIVVDPIGAMLSVLAFEAFLPQHSESLMTTAFLAVGKTLLWGTLFGFAGAAVLVLWLRRFWIPDYLKNAITLVVVMICFVVSNHLQEESGLLAVTLMGILMANQRFVPIKDILEFKENLQVILISFLFITLAARFKPSDLQYLDYSTVAFIVLMILLVRPLAVFLSCWRSGLEFKDKLLMAALAPRGIVAAAVAAVFAEKLAMAGVEGWEYLAPVTFSIILGTVAAYSIATPILARRLGLSIPNSQDVLFVGAHDWALRLAEELRRCGISVTLVDTNWDHVTIARREGFPCLFGNVFSHEIHEEIEVLPLGKLLALTPNDEANALATSTLKELFGAKNVYQLAPAANSGPSRGAIGSSVIRGRILFGKDLPFNEITERMRSGWKIKATKITEEYSIDAFQKQSAESPRFLFAIDQNGKLRVESVDLESTKYTGCTLIALVKTSS